MKKAITIRIDPDLLVAAQACARQDNRTFTNLIETLLRQRIAASSSFEASPPPARSDRGGGTRVG